MRLHFILVLVLPLLSGLGLRAQSPPPQRLELPRFDSLPPNQLISAAFYPLGFSDKGHFAYAIAPADEACGCYFFEFRIQNLVTDQVLYRYDYRGDRGVDRDLYGDLDALWADKSASFLRAMDRFGILPEEPPFKLGTTGFNVAVLPQKFRDPGLPDSEFMSGARVDVSDPQKGKKTVARLQFPQQHVHSLEAMGYFKSPFEDRVALILVRIDRGWEGLPKVLDFEVVGVHRTLGFP